MRTKEVIPTVRALKLKEAGGCLATAENSEGCWGDHFSWGSWALRNQIPFHWSIWLHIMGLPTPTVGKMWWQKLPARRREVMWSWMPAETANNGSTTLYDYSYCRPSQESGISFSSKIHPWQFMVTFPLWALQSQPLQEMDCHLPLVWCCFETWCEGKRKLTGL